MLVGHFADDLLAEVGTGLGDDQGELVGLEVALDLDAGLGGQLDLVDLPGNRVLGRGLDCGLEAGLLVFEDLLGLWCFDELGQQVFFFFN